MFVLMKGKSYIGKRRTGRIKTINKNSKNRRNTFEFPCSSLLKETYGTRKTVESDTRAETITLEQDNIVHALKLREPLLSMLTLCTSEKN
jgi:hypothetical protein